MVKIKSKRIIELRHKARRNSIKEGGFASIKTALGDSYITPFAIAINSSNFLIGMLSAITGLVGPISQWFSSRLIEKYKRKKIIVTATFYEALAWIPLILISFLFYKGILTSFLPLLLLIFFSLYIIIANVTTPAWFSWTGDLVDEDYRGKWFSKRHFICGFVLIIFTIVAALFLDFLKKQDQIILGFIILFFLAIIARFISRQYFKKIYEPKLKLKKADHFSFWQFIKKAPENNFGRYVLFKTVMVFAVFIASPFFAVYMLRNLNFSYVTFMLIVLSQTFFGLLTVKHWGKFADKYGNYEVMKLTVVLISIFPALWLISSSPIFLIFVPSLMGGIGWAGFNLAAGNFIYDSVSPQKRGLAVSYHNVLYGFGIFLGAGLGAILVKTLTITFMDELLFIFLISSFARLTIGLIMLPYVKEVRKTKKFNSKMAIKNSEMAIKSLIPKRIKIPMLEGAHDLLIKETFKFRK